MGGGIATRHDDSKVVAREQIMQFSKEPTMSNFGDLPFGEIPEPLKYVRPFNQTTLSNGIRVCSERIPGQLAYVGVYVNAGSRQENLSTTGTNYLLSQMFRRGSNNRSKTEFNDSLADLGA